MRIMTGLEVRRLSGLERMEGKEWGSGCGRRWHAVVAVTATPLVEVSRRGRMKMHLSSHHRSPTQRASNVHNFWFCTFKSVLSTKDVPLGTYTVSGSRGQANHQCSFSHFWHSLVGRRAVVKRFPGLEM